MRCSIKASDGLIYPLAKCFVFINKPTVIIAYEDIEFIEVGIPYITVILTFFFSFFSNIFMHLFLILVQAVRARGQLRLQILRYPNHLT